MVRGESCHAWQRHCLHSSCSRPPAHAVIKGTASSHASYTVRLVGKQGYCSGVVIARDAIVTAAHCARTIPVLAGRSLAVVGISRTAVLDDGRRVNVSGDAVVLRLASPLPADVAPAPIGEGSGNSYTIAGYGTTDERSRDPVSAPHEARLVAASPGALVDPDRTGSIGASASSAIPAGRCCAAACWSASSAAPRTLRRILRVGISPTGCG